MFGCRECSDLFNAMDAGDCKVLQNIDHYPPDQRHYHHGQLCTLGPVTRNVDKLSPHCSVLHYTAISGRHYLHYTLPLVSLKQLPHFAD